MNNTDIKEIEDHTASCRNSVMNNDWGVIKSDLITLILNSEHLLSKQKTLDQENLALHTSLNTATDKLKYYKGRHAELLHAVACKFPNESRHETALRYIKEREADRINQHNEKQDMVDEFFDQQN